MEKLNLMGVWIREFPLWEGQLLTDTTEPALHSCGLFPMGTKLLHRKEDVLGNTRCRYADSFRLRRRAVKSPEAAAWIMAFADWAQSSTPPAFGENTHLAVENGKMVSTAPDGTAIYELTVTITYEKEYEHGKN